MAINLEYLLIVILILVNVYLVIQSKNKDRDNKIENNKGSTILILEKLNPFKNSRVSLKKICVISDNKILFNI